MNSLRLVFLVLCVTSVIYGELKKYCNWNRYFEKNDGTYKCSQFPSNTSQIITNSIHFLQNNEDGQCVEFSDNFYIFSVNNSVVSQFQLVEENVYPKCCPLNAVYNVDIHGCEIMKNVNLSHIKEKFIKIGLPECKVIVDRVKDSGTDDHYKPGNYSSFFDSSCIDRIKNGSFVTRKCEDSKEICSEIKCVQKCCPDGQSHIKNNETLQCVEGYQGINLTEMALRNRTEFPEGTYLFILLNISKYLSWSTVIFSCETKSYFFFLIVWPETIINIQKTLTCFLMDI